MRLDCPHCGSQLSVALPESGVGVPNDSVQPLQGDEHVCRECERELGVYHY